MTKTYDERIDKMLQSAERHSRCLTRPRDNALRRALIYRSKHATDAPIYSPHDGLYIRKDYWDSLCRSDQVLHMVKALSHIHPQWIFDSYTAAVIRGWNVPYALLDDIHIVMPYHYRTQTVSARASRDITCDTVDGLRVTTTAQTLHECLRTADFRDALPIADSALRQLHIPTEALIRELQADRKIARSRSSRRTIDILKLANPLSESGGESFARATMIMLGFAIPELQVEYPDPMNPNSTFRVDFRWVFADGTVILGEFDGKQKYVDMHMTKGKDAIETLSAERLRESRLSVSGARIVRFSHGDVCNLAYFKQLLDAYGVPRDPTPRFADSLAIEANVSEAIDEMPPLECYEDLIALHRC